MLRDIQTLALWSAVLAAIAVPAAAQDMALRDILIDGEDWQLVGEGYAFSEGPAVDPKGSLYFTDVFLAKIYRLDAQG
jgi:gluconolactonase